ncbi:hypothetical protein QZH41_019224, partial [Actinostola sp. cb2023]
RIQVKDFRIEVRGIRDIERFLERPTVLLDVHERSVEEIMDAMLKSMKINNDGSMIDLTSARDELLTNGSIHRLSRMIQGTERSEGGGWEESQGWLVAMAELSSVQQSHVAIARLRHGTNLGRTLQGTHLVVLVLSPRKTKMTKTSLETGRTFATLLLNIDVRQQLLEAENQDDFLVLRRDGGTEGRRDGGTEGRRDGGTEGRRDGGTEGRRDGGTEGRRTEGRRRDGDGTEGRRDGGTEGRRDGGTEGGTAVSLSPEKLYLHAQEVVSRCKEALASGEDGEDRQPEVVRVTSSFAQPGENDQKVKLFSFGTGLKEDFLRRWPHYKSDFVDGKMLASSSLQLRSTNEIFALFISVAFTVAAVSSIIAVASEAMVGLPVYELVGNLRPFLDAHKREALADYALPVSVVVFSFVGSYVFQDISMHQLDYAWTISFKISPISSLSIGAIFGACGLGFCLSFLFFMAQNIVSAMVNNPSNRLKKGTAYHLDLLVIAILNACLSLFGLPWVHAALPHSPLHVRALADVEERVDQGHVHEIIVKVRENRLSLLLAHIMVAMSLLMLPTPLKYIPPPVLDGLFLFVAFTPLFSNQMFERLLLLVTDQSAYPPNHYIRRVPQRSIHGYTGIQFLQLFVLCAVGFIGTLSYIKMVFPLLLILLLPIRYFFVQCCVFNLKFY